MKFSDLDAQEQLALAGLVRLMVRMDGEFTPKEAAAVSALAREIGATSFWSMMTESQTMEMEELSDLVSELPRKTVREWMYGVLVGLAAVDGIDAAESELLSWLMEVWELEP